MEVFNSMTIIIMSSHTQNHILRRKDVFQQKIYYLHVQAHIWPSESTFLKLTF